MNVSKLDLARQTLNLNITPIHVAIMMDGNGRWANKNSLSRKEGHIAGSKAFLEVVKRLIEYDIKYISIFAFSTENWNRPGEEIKDLMDLSKDFIQNNLELIDKYNMDSSDKRFILNLYEECKQNYEQNAKSNGRGTK